MSILDTDTDEDQPLDDWIDDRRDELEQLADSDLNSAWIAQALLDEDGDGDD